MHYYFKEQIKMVHQNLLFDIGNQKQRYMKHCDDKRARGEFYTTGDPFSLSPFTDWATSADISNKVILEPFAGANHIIRALQKNGFCNNYASFDIKPNNADVKLRNVLESFPTGYDACVTNPPWLARNSATRRNLPYPETSYDDLYKHCIELCLNNCKYVGALIPASFLQSGLYRERLATYILLHDDDVFNSTDNPVCLALFNENKTKSTAIFYDNDYIGELAELEKKLPKPSKSKEMKFNDPDGDVGFISFDNTSAPSIRFCDVNEIKNYSIKESSRFITRISVGSDSHIIKKLNNMIKDFRSETKDLFLTPFKGIRKDGCYRRRMSFDLARSMINAV